LSDFVKLTPFISLNEKSLNVQHGRIPQQFQQFLITPLSHSPGGDKKLYEIQMEIKILLFQKVTKYSGDGFPVQFLNIEFEWELN